LRWQQSDTEQQTKNNFTHENSPTLKVQIRAVELSLRKLEVFFSCA
jgi:hypothetical protein